MKISQKRRWNSLRTAAILILLIMCVACRQGKQYCCLCSAPPSDYPCIIELSTGNIAELKPAEYGTAFMTTIGSIALSSISSESVTAKIPSLGEHINQGLFCKSCLAKLKGVINNGYVIADLHNPSRVEVFGIEDGFMLNTNNTCIYAKSTDTAEQIIVIAIVTIPQQTEQTAEGQFSDTPQNSFVAIGRESFLP